VYFFAAELTKKLDKRGKKGVEVVTMTKKGHHFFEEKIG